MIKKLKVGLASFLAGATVLALSSFGDINGRQVEPTGNNPHSWGGDTLTNIVQNTSDVPKQMNVGDIGKSFRIWYDFSLSSIDFSNTNKYHVNFHASEGTNSELYAVGTLNTSGQGMCDFFIDQASLSDTNIFLTNNAPMQITLVGPNFVWGLEQELGYSSQSNSLQGFTYNQGLGEAVGGIKYNCTVTGLGTHVPGTTNTFYGSNINQSTDAYVETVPGNTRVRCTGHSITGLDPSNVTEN